MRGGQGRTGSLGCGRRDQGTKSKAPLVCKKAQVDSASLGRTGLLYFSALCLPVSSIPKKFWCNVKYLLRSQSGCQRLGEEGYEEERIRVGAGGGEVWIYGEFKISILTVLERT